MSDGSQNGWNEYSRLVLKELETLSDSIDGLRTELVEVKQELAKMQAKYIGPDKDIVSVDYENGLLTLRDGTIKKNFGHPVMLAYRNLQDSTAKLEEKQEVAAMSQKLGMEDVDLDQGFTTTANIESDERKAKGAGADFSYTDGIIGATGIDFSPQFDRSTLPSLSKEMSGAGNPMGTGNAVVMANNKSQSDNTSIQNVNAGGLSVSNPDIETEYLIASGLGR